MKEARSSIAKRQAESEDTPREETNPNQASASDEPPSLAHREDTNQSNASREPISWWDSANALCSFMERAHQNDDDEDANDDEAAWDVKAMVRKRVEQLRKGLTTVGGWKLMLDDFDSRNACLPRTSSIFK